MKKRRLYKMPDDKMSRQQKPTKCQLRKKFQNKEKLKKWGRVERKMKRDEE